MNVQHPTSNDEYIKVLKGCYKIKSHTSGQVHAIHRHKANSTMIVRNLKDKEVLDTTYIAHGGAVARMVLDQRTLKEIGFLASAILDKGRKIESHVDPMEEIYFIVMGEGEMTVGDETRHVIPGDAVWIPAGEPHALENTGEDLLFLMVVASPNW